MEKIITLKKPINTGHDTLKLELIEWLTHLDQDDTIPDPAEIRMCVIAKHNSLYDRNRRPAIELFRIYGNRQDPDKLELSKNFETNNRHT